VEGHLKSGLTHPDFLHHDGLRQELAPFYSGMGRPSIDPELLIRMLIVGYCFGIRSERRLASDVDLFYTASRRRRITPNPRRLTKNSASEVGSGTARTTTTSSRDIKPGSSRKLKVNAVDPEVAIRLNVSMA
jgi:Transposase domain (DUF772)